MKRPDNALFQPYTGPLKWTLTTGAAKTAMQSYYGQRYRSKLLGLSEPEYSAREFVSWWLGELKGFIGEDPTCGRIDHSRGYSWDNICLQSRSENSRECAVRLKKGTKENKVKNEKPIVVYAKNGDELFRFKSQHEAAKHFGVQPSSITVAVKQGSMRRDSALSSFILRGAV